MVAQPHWTGVPPRRCSPGTGYLAFPVTIGIAILRFHLYDLGLVVRKTLLYGLLAAFITAVYVGIVVGVGALVGSGDSQNLALSVAATAVVAVAFAPVRNRAERLANRLVYGKRATPYEVLTEFSGAWVRPTTTRTCCRG